jgi:hypothetical protein
VARKSFSSASFWDSLSRIGEVVDAASVDAPDESEARVRAVVGMLLDVAQDNRAFVGTYLPERHWFGVDEESASALPNGPTAVDDEVLSGDVTGRVAGQEQ